MRTDYKDMLIGLIATLSSEECRDAYYLLQGKNKTPYEYMEFDKVKLTEGQYNKLIWIWGEEKTKACIEILNDWLIKKGDKIKPNLSHYRNITGWVEYQYYRTHPANDKSLRYFGKIDTAWKARKYIHRIPAELRAYDLDVKLLVDKFGTDILK